MIIAFQKKKENIAEYVLYMWHIEEIIRLYNADIEIIEKKLISEYNVDNKTKSEIKNWYSDLIFMMNEERILEKGHLQIVKNIVREMNAVSVELMSAPEEQKYQQIFENAYPEIVEFSKIAKDKFENDIECGLNLLQSIMLLRLQKKEISSETLISVQKISKLLSFLSQKYNKFKEEENL